MCFVSRIDRNKMTLAVHVLDDIGELTGTDLLYS